MNFNTSFNESGEKPTFMYKRNLLVPHSWQIFAIRKGKTDYEPVGEYTLLDLSEDTELTEKRLINMVAILNGKRNLMDLSGLTDKRLLFNIVPEKPDSVNQKIIFRTYDGGGVSKENAILVVEKGVFKDESN